MPNAAPRACPHPGCPLLDCREHHPRRRDGWAQHNAGRSQTERGYGADWRKVRIVVLNRDGGLCQPCGRAGKVVVADQVDHIVPIERGGARLDPRNLEACCRACNLAKAQREAMLCR